MIWQVCCLRPLLICITLKQETYEQFKTLGLRPLLICITLKLVDPIVRWIEQFETPINLHHSQTVNPQSVSYSCLRPLLICITLKRTEYQGHEAQV